MRPGKENGAGCSGGVRDRAYINMDPSDPAPAVGIGSRISIENGTAASNYGAVDGCSAFDGDRSCAHELFPILKQQPIKPGSTATVVGFACLKDDSARKQGGERAHRCRTRQQRGPMRSHRVERCRAVLRCDHARAASAVRGAGGLERLADQ